MFSVATKKGGVCNAFPDVCKTPSPGGPIPIPYPNIAQLTAAKSGTCAKRLKKSNKKVSTKKTILKDSTGDEAGTAKGIISSKTRGEAKFLRASSKVKAQGQGLVLMTANVGQNGNNANIPAGILSTVTETKTKSMM